MEDFSSCFVLFFFSRSLFLSPHCMPGRELSRLSQKGESDEDDHEADLLLRGYHVTCTGKGEPYLQKAGVKLFLNVSLRPRGKDYYILWSLVNFPLWIK